MPLVIMHLHYRYTSNQNKYELRNWIESTVGSDNSMNDSCQNAFLIGCWKGKNPFTVSLFYEPPMAGNFTVVCGH